MGRSVNYHTNAIEVLYRQSPCDSDDPYENQEYWADFIYEIQHGLPRKYPSFVTAGGWHDRDVRLILENDHCGIWVSEYCGLASISIVPRDDLEYGACQGIAHHWCVRCSKGIKAWFAENWQLYNCIARASNGEAFYTKAS